MATSLKRRSTGRPSLANGVSPVYKIRVPAEIFAQLRKRGPDWVRAVLINAL